VRLFAHFLSFASVLLFPLADVDDCIFASPFYIKKSLIRLFGDLFANHKIKFFIRPVFQLHSRGLSFYLCAPIYQPGKTKKQKGIEIRSNHENLLPVENICGWHTTVRTDKVCMLLDLSQTPEELWKDFKSKLRSQIRKMGKNGLTFS